MKIQDERIEKIIRRFKNKLIKNGLDTIFDCIEHPGGIFIVERKDLSEREMDDANAFIELAETNKEDGKFSHPFWNIFLIKEEMQKMTDREISNTLAHEVSHILMSYESRFYPDLHILSEQACDVLAERYFKCPKKDKSQGYVHK